MIAVSFLSPLRLKSTSIPSPPEVHKPATSEPKLIVFFTNSIVSITDIAQFGINPTNDTSRGCSGEFIRQYFANTSSEPERDKMNANTTEIININMKIFNVCLRG